LQACFFGPIAVNKGMIYLNILYSRWARTPRDLALRAMRLPNTAACTAIVLSALAAVR